MNSTVLSELKNKFNKSKGEDTTESTPPKSESPTLPPRTFTVSVHGNNNGLNYKHNTSRNTISTPKSQQVNTVVVTSRIPTGEKEKKIQVMKN